MVNRYEAQPAGLVYRRRSRESTLRRAFDAIVASAVLVAASPVLAVAVVAILIEDGGPILFKQQRTGQYERLFTMFKLRTMRAALCGDAASPTSSSDARITRVGRILRRTSIDELPQLVNVIRGDMSLVGPRPEMPFIVQRYEDWQHLRHLARPGLTCLWQVKLRSTVPLDRPEATLLDIAYIRNASWRVDAMILFETILAVVRPKGAY